MIPSILWQTAKSVSDVNDTFLKSWLIKNPTLENVFMDDNDCKNFISDNFSDEVFDVYMSLPLGIMRADMWRIAVVYINGGIYADTDVWCEQSLDQLLKDKDIVICQEHHDTNLTSNFFFAAKPNHPFFKEVIDLMVENFHSAFNAESPMVVQNFGMHSVQKARDKYDIELILKQDVDLYVSHHCHGTWREHETHYRNARFMKPVTFFTTFNQNGYDLYGKTWIETFIQNVANKSTNIKALIYAHNVYNIKVNHPQIEVIDYDIALPEHIKWKDDFASKATHFSDYVKDNTIRFSHKGFVINDALNRITDGYAIWLDGDCVMHDQSYNNFPENLLNGYAVACQLEHARQDAHHIESGILLFDMNNADISKFKEKFSLNYKVDRIITMSEPYDGFVIYRSLIDSEITFNDLNEKYGIGGIQSCPTLTFLHPEIASRFTHNIGLTGKSSYEDWDDIKYKDKVFSKLAAVSILTPHQLKIRNLKAKKKLINGK